MKKTNNAQNLQNAIQIAKNHGIVVNEKSIISPSRAAEFVFQRAIIAITMHHNGSGASDIGRALNRCHASAYNLLAYEKAKSSPYYRRKFKKFKEALLKSEENTKSQKAKKPKRKLLPNSPESATDSKEIMAKLRYHTEMANHYAQLI